MTVDMECSAQPALNSLGTKGCRASGVSAPIARLTQSPSSWVEGRRGAAGWANRSSDDAPPRQLGATRRERGAGVEAMEEERDRDEDNMATTSCSLRRRLGAFGV
jgi:hypothetical protein